MGEGGGREGRRVEEEGVTIATHRKRSTRWCSFSRMGSPASFEIIDATDHVDSGVQYSPGIFSETETVHSHSSNDTLA